VKAAEFVALIVALCLFGVGVALAVAGFTFGTVAFTAGSLAAFGQSGLAGVLWWGFRLANQRAALASGPSLAGDRLTSTTDSAGPLGFRMSNSDETAAAAPTIGDVDETKTLDVGFQRVLVSICGTVLLILAAIICYRVYADVTSVKPGETIGIASVPLTQGAIVFAGVALLAYIALLFTTAGDPDRHNFSATTRGVILMGLPGAVAVAGAILLGFFGTLYAAQMGAIIVAVFLLLQGMELLINAFRSYNAVREFDQEPVDLQALPLVPMFSSASIVGVQLVITQTLGLARRRNADEEAGVFARVMPRIVIVTFVVLVLVTCFRVVPAGTVAIRERLGLASAEDIDHPFQPGLHFTAPWPIDQLVVIPTERINLITVGEELSSEENSTLGASFWTLRHGGDDSQDKFLTGDISDTGTATPEMLESFVAVWWRVKDPSLFYRNISHSDFVDNEAKTKDAIVRPIYEQIVQQAATQAVTRIFAAHTLDELMANSRLTVVEDCKTLMQKFLDGNSAEFPHMPPTGIEIADVTIKEIHPPMGQVQITVQGRQLDPARAYEGVVIAREFAEAVINRAQGESASTVINATGQAEKIRQDADGDFSTRVNTAAGEANRLQGLFSQANDKTGLSRDHIYYQTLNDVLPNTNKILLDKGVVPPDIIQLTKDGSGLLVRPTQPPPQ
jgi:regulator of protease activity HflC (stomatin/prohibitin superfamily)